MKILLTAPLSAYSGYGNDGIGLATALVEAGHDVYLQPSHVSPPLPKIVSDLLMKNLVAPFDLGIIHVDPGQMEVSKEMRRSCDMVVGWTMWEYTTLRNLKNRRTCRTRFKDFNAMFAYDEVSKGALQPYMPKGSPVIALQGGFSAEFWTPQERDWHSDRFSFCMNGALHARKDPFTAIEAFRQLKLEFPEEFEPAELHLHTTVPGLHPKMEDWIPKLRIHYKMWPTETLRAFYGSQHVLLAPSHGEGKNLPALEMLSTGGTVIATNWGGHRVWLHPDIAYPLDYVLREEPDAPGCFSARADVDHLKTLMLHVFRNRDEAHQKGDLASRLIPQMYSWDSVADKLMLGLREVPGGESLFSRSRMVA